MNRFSFLVLILVFLLATQTVAQQKGFIAPPPGEGPVEVTVTLHINKIYNVNSVDETYQIDGYLVFNWLDERLRFSPQDSLSDVLIYENARALGLAKNKIWMPSFELINIQGKQETQNLQIIIKPDGNITYNERFFGVFHSQMDFKRFPFDTKTFVLQIEAFSYNIEKIVFKDLSLLPPDGTMDDKLGEDWEFIEAKTNVVTEDYGHLMDRSSDAEEDSFSRAQFAVKAQRLSGYYVWQVLFPLCIIILASFTIYWIKEFASQIAIGFTLMLTVVAFNFYSASILPKLPYNTFIEYVIIVGYIFILIGIMAVIINHWALHQSKKYELFKYLRVAVPSGYLLIMVLLYFIYLY